MSYVKYQIKIIVYVDDLGERERVIVAKCYNDDPECLWWVSDYGFDCMDYLVNHPEAIKLN